MIQTKYIAIEKLILHPDNPRKIDDEQFAILCESIVKNSDYFETRPILCNKEMVVFAGNMRLRAAQKVGLKEVPVAIMDITPEKERELMIRDNVSNGEWDAELLPALFDNKELTEWGVDLSKFGVFGKYDNKEIDPDSLKNENSIFLNFSNEDYLLILELLETGKRRGKFDTNEELIKNLLNNYV